MKKDSTVRTPSTRPAEVPASEVKNSWHQYLDRVSRQRQEVVVTRYGKPIAKLVPIEPSGEDEQTAGLFGWLRGTVTVHGDIIAPIDEPWDADA
jgi:prevent-host-death family protein